MTQIELLGWAWVGISAMFTLIVRVLRFSDSILAIGAFSTLVGGVLIVWGVAHRRNGDR